MRQLFSSLFALMAAPVSAFPSQVFLIPEVGTEQTVTTGSEMFIRENGVPTVELAADYKIGGLLGGEQLKAGQRLQIDEAESTGTNLVACTVDSGSFEGTCLIDKESDGQFDKHKPTGAVVSSKLKTPLPYRLAGPLPSPSRTGVFRQTLTYLGINNKVLRIAYREFAEDIARPAFTNELSFTLSDSFPETIAYKDVVIDVLGVSNAGIRYVVRKASK